MSKTKNILTSLASRMMQNEQSKIHSIVKNLQIKSENPKIPISSLPSQKPQRNKVLNLVKHFESASKIPNTPKKTQIKPPILNRLEHTNVLNMAKHFESKDKLSTNLQMLNNVDLKGQFKMKSVDCRFSTARGMHSNVSKQHTPPKSKTEELEKVFREEKPLEQSKKIPSLRSNPSQQRKWHDSSTLTNINSKYVIVPLTPKTPPSPPPKLSNSVVQSFPEKTKTASNLTKTSQPHMNIPFVPLKPPQPTKQINLSPEKPINVVKRFESTCGTFPFPPKPPLPPPPPPPKFPAHLIRPPCLPGYEQSNARFAPCVNLRPYFCPPERNSYQYSSFSENIDFVPSGEQKPWWYSHLKCEFTISDFEDLLPFKA